LDTFHVKLSTTRRVHIEGSIGLVKSNNLTTEKVLARSKTSWYGDIVLSTVGYESINSPGSSTQSSFGELDPDVTSSIGRSWCNPRDDWTLVGPVDDIVCGRVVIVMPFDCDLNCVREGSKEAI
jgi:hypothetical protein